MPSWFKAASNVRADEAQVCGQELMRSVGKGLLALAAAAAANYSIFCDSPAMAESLTVAFPVSRTTEVIDFVSCLIECCWVVSFVSIQYYK